MKAQLLDQLRSLRDLALSEIVNALKVATLQAAGHRIQDIQAQLELSPGEMKAARGRLKTATEQLDEPE